MGIKMFIVEYIYARFPRIKRRHDSTYRIWKGLPTDSLLEKQYQKAAIDRVSRLTMVFIPQYQGLGGFLFLIKTNP